MPPRTVAVIGAVCLTIGWLLASTVSPPVATSQSLPARVPPTIPVPEPVSTARLQLTLPQTAPAPVSRRNPFVFATASRSTARAESRSGGESREVASVGSDVPRIPSGPQFSLLGLATSGEARTAVLSDGQTVFLVKAGEQVGAYQVADITDASITLADASGVQHVLRLR
jgi:hypothetical protein